VVWEGHHLGVTGATEGGCCPDDTQGGDDLLVERAGAADDVDGTIVDGVVHAHTVPFGQRETVLHALAHPDLDGVGTTAIDTGDAQPLVHGGAIEIVVPGQPVLAGQSCVEGLKRYPFRVRRT